MLLVVFLALNEVRGEIRCELSFQWQCGGAVGRGPAFRQCLEILVGFSSPLIWAGSWGAPSSCQTLGRLLQS